METIAVTNGLGTFDQLVLSTNFYTGPGTTEVEVLANFRLYEWTCVCLENGAPVHALAWDDDRLRLAVQRAHSYLLTVWVTGQVVNPSVWVLENAPEYGEEDIDD